MFLRKLFILSLLSGIGCYGQMNVAGSRAIVVTPSKTTGLEAVLVVENAADATLEYTSSSASASQQTKWSRFSVTGGGYAEEITDVEVAGNKSTVKIKPGDMGYIVESGGRQTAYWVVDYAGHHPTLTAFEVSADSDCDRVMFTPTGGFDRINYYSINGAPTELDRGITLEYTDLEFEGETQDGAWQTYTHTVDFADIQGTFSVQAPLCNTTFQLTGDRFLEEWGDPISLTTNSYTTGRVEAKTWAVQATRENDNEQNQSTNGLGGSAPCDITFIAIPTDAAIFTEWQFSMTEDFEDVLYRFTDPEFTYTFTEFGTTYVKFVCADASGECNYESEVYTVTVGESKLQCPNAFSPQNQDGVNDEWKVSYSSLISYDCHIFNRWGKELFSSTNPAEGWDGRSGGKFVPAGVYFYVIKAEGADGVKYKLSGDINIVGSKLRTTGEGTEAAEP